MINILKLRKLEKEKNQSEMEKDNNEPVEEIKTELEVKFVEENSDEPENENPVTEIIDQEENQKEFDLSEIDSAADDETYFAEELTEFETVPKNEKPVSEVDLKEEKEVESEIDASELLRQQLLAEIMSENSPVDNSEMKKEEESEENIKIEEYFQDAKDQTVEKQEIKVVTETSKSKSEEVKTEQIIVPEKSQEINTVNTPTKEKVEKVIQLVGFSLANEIYGVDITCIKEIIRMTEITRVPKAPEFVEGVINLRGNVIPVINLRKKVGMKITGYDKDTRIIIIELKGMVIGFIVDAVKEVMRIPDDLIGPAPELAVGKRADYITSVAKFNDELIILIDSEKILSKDEKEKLTEK